MFLCNLKEQILINANFSERCNIITVYKADFVFKFTFRPPPLNFSLNLVDLVILAFLDGDYFYK